MKQVGSVPGQAADTLETIRALKLASAQIDLSLQESGDSVGNLIDAVTSAASYVSKVQADISLLAGATELNHAEIDTMHAKCKIAESKLQQAIMALQFYDRLSQRLLHVQENLSAVTDVIQAPGQQHSSLWTKLHRRMRSVYSLEQEQRIHELLQKKSTEQDLINEQGEKIKRTDNDIELF